MCVPSIPAFHAQIALIFTAVGRGQVESRKSVLRDDRPAQSVLSTFDLTPGTPRWPARPHAGVGAWISACIVLAMVSVKAPESRQSALEASESRYRRLFETAQDAILILDAEEMRGRIIDA